MLIPALFALGAIGAAADEAADAAARARFDATLDRVDEALRENPGHVQVHALDSCLSRRNLAVRLFQIGEPVRAMRRLDYCVKMLQIPEPKVAVTTEPTPEERAAKAAKELERSLALEPDVARGLEIWRECAGCHRAEGWGLPNGSVPQLAGQHREVVLKQLADIRAGSRENFLMLPYASIDRIGGPQGLADVAAYIDTLEISVDNAKGPGTALAKGEKLYAENCATCHGASGEGDGAKRIPRIQSQHYPYLVRQFEAIRDGTRMNAHPEMRETIQGFDEAQMSAVLDHVSRLQPPVEFQAPPGWQNPDFAD